MRRRDRSYQGVRHGGHSVRGGGGVGGAARRDEARLLEAGRDLQGWIPEPEVAEIGPRNGAEVEEGLQNAEAEGGPQGGEAASEDRGPTMVEEDHDGSRRDLHVPRNRDPMDLDPFHDGPLRPNSLHGFPWKEQQRRGRRGLGSQGWPQSPRREQIDLRTE